MLEENQRFIQATMEHQNAGNLHAAAQCVFASALFQMEAFIMMYIARGTAV